MVRLIASCGLMLLIACAAQDRRELKSPEPTFQSAEERAIACRHLRDHIVNLYVTEAADEEGPAMSPEARARLRADWAELLERRGTFDRFAASCTAGLTPRKYRCGMASTNTEDLVACMRLSATSGKTPTDRAD